MSIPEGLINDSVRVDLFNGLIPIRQWTVIWPTALMQKYLIRVGRTGGSGPPYPRGSGPLHPPDFSSLPPPPFFSHIFFSGYTPTQN